MIKIAILDDEESSSYLLKENIEKFFSEKELKIEIYIFSDPFLFLSQYTLEFKLVFLDIEIPGLNGMEVAKKIREQDNSSIIIFVTNMAQYALKGYEVDASDFIIKPVVYSDFFLKMERIYKKLVNEFNPKIEIKYNGNRKFIQLKDVEYVEVSAHNLVYHIGEETDSVRGTLKSVENMLTENNFCKCNNYCMVNLKYVSGINGYECQINNGKEKKTILISRPRKQIFIRELNDYIRGNL